MGSKISDAIDWLFIIVATIVLVRLAFTDWIPSTVFIAYAAFYSLGLVSLESLYRKRKE